MLPKITIIIFFIIFLSNSLLENQKDYTNIVKYLEQQIRADSRFRHAAWQKLAYIVDTYGARMWGSKALQDTINYLKSQAQLQHFDSVRLQPVSNFTKWVRGKQQLILKSPRPYSFSLDVIGLGSTIPGDVQAQVIVVKNYQQLQKMKDKVVGKIVCFNNKWINYDESGQYRLYGASHAAKYGAVAALVRSVTPKSIYTVHTGYQQYDQKFPKIPAAAITIQDADMFQRMQDRGQKIVVHLILENQLVSNCNSSNLILQIRGSQKPEQIVLAGGHIDSWDTGSQTGANDDGGGFVTVYQAFRMLNTLGLRPRRTLRFIAWSGQQSGSPIDGAAQYYEKHKEELNKHIAAFQSDWGSTQLYGFGYTAKDGQGQNLFKEILNKYMSLINAGQFSDDGMSFDVLPLYEKAGVPMINNLIKDSQDHEFYYTYHHTGADSMQIMDAQELDSNVLGIASLLYIIADLEVSLR